MILFVVPNEAELTSYNELKYKKEQISHFITTSSTIKKALNIDKGEYNLSKINKNNFISSNINAEDNFDISKSSTWNTQIELDNFDTTTKVFINKTIKIRSKIKKVSYYSPKIIID